ncbi:acyl-CoA Delta-9 desaturase-like [Amphibalanus amphitrite]|uniref:acyl-CoA Delta-9 desaturase-like n=1 Tax=Amphibalanus amphitrite TaxID=1232801 RepID=UPI001C9264D1|nr:acyl-CoA Delta-9 desaturase-like [Amphibalanus amphitrite]
MAPNVATRRGPELSEEEVAPPAAGSAAKRPPTEIVWRSVAFFTILHILSVAGLVRALTAARWQTLVFGLFCYCIGGVGVTAGAHRLWSHRSFSANLKLRVLLMLMYTMAGQNHIHEWVRDHRLHHRHSETDADPHDATRGFFFAHCGWLVVRKHPQVKLQGRHTDLSDLEADPVVMFQKRWYLPLAAVMVVGLPTLVPYLCWGECLLDAYLIAVLKYVVTLHGTWLVNSAAHMWGMHPYDRHIHPAENRSVAALAFGEGWHNYHHSFPWDYKAAELPNYTGNVTTGFIDFFHRIGWASGLKTVSADIIQRRAARNGDGSYKAPH